MWLKTTLETSITYSIPNKNYSNSDRYSTLGKLWIKDNHTHYHIWLSAIGLNQIKWLQYVCQFNCFLKLHITIEQAMQNEHVWLQLKISRSIFACFVFQEVTVQWHGTSIVLLFRNIITHLVIYYNSIIYITHLGILWYEGYNTL